jgi:hypothetical protein
LDSVRSGIGFQTIGNLIHGQSAEKSTLMLGEVEVGGGLRRVLAAPVRVEGNPHCLIVPDVGRAFTPSTAWIRQMMWDITAYTEFNVELARFTISSKPAEHGEIAQFDGEWLIAANIDEQRPERAEWINIATAEPVRPRVDLLRFDRWRLCHRSSNNELITLFQPSGPAAEPRIRALG